METWPEHLAYKPEFNYPPLGMIHGGMITVWEEQGGPYTYAEAKAINQEAAATVLVIGTAAGIVLCRIDPAHCDLITVGILGLSLTSDTHVFESGDVWRVKIVYDTGPSLIKYRYYKFHYNEDNILRTFTSNYSYDGAMWYSENYMKYTGE